MFSYHRQTANTSGQNAVDNTRLYGVICCYLERLFTNYCLCDLFRAVFPRTPHLGRNDPVRRGCHRANLDERYRQLYWARRIRCSFGLSDHSKKESTQPKNQKPATRNP